MTFYADSDSDGYGSTTVSKKACAKPTGYVTSNTDCNDSDAAINPGATETCNSKDDDCDGLTDDADSSVSGQATFYQDSDGDTYGSATVTKKSCAKPAGYVTSGTDCDDTNSNVNPGKTETCNGVDDNCDGIKDEGVKTTFYKDADGDGYGSSANTTQACTVPSGYVTSSTDCDDANAAVYPGKTETCNSVDDNCNGQTDEGVKTTFYRDADGDGYGNASNAIQACTLTTGYVTSSTDCDDTNANVNPGKTETCNGIDDNCSGAVDEGVKITFYRDSDGDGYGNASVTTTACTLPSGYVTSSTDCDDTNANVKPGATEVCNGIDDNCTGGIDEGVKITFYRDADGDGYGSASVTTQACSLPTGYVTNSTDCNDASASVKPGATETCNGVDDNCSGTTDEGVLITYYRDADGDGYGTSSVTTTGCTAPSGYVTNSTDCNDASASVKPGATETCNSVDDNCNGTVDEGVKITYYRDADGDGYGTTTTTTTACSVPSGYVTNSTDCNDTNANVNPGKSEVPGNSIDDNCNGQTDEAAACSTLSNPKASALAACQAKFGSNCYDTGTASYIGYATGYSQGSNCTTDTNLWRQYCYATGTDSYNCNTCVIGEMQQAHNPCTCTGENTAVIGYWCTAGFAPDPDLPSTLKAEEEAEANKVPMCSEEDEEAGIADVPSAYLGCNPKGRIPEPAPTQDVE